MTASGVSDLEKCLLVNQELAQTCCMARKCAAGIAKLAAVADQAIGNGKGKLTERLGLDVMAAQAAPRKATIAPSSVSSDPLATPPPSSWLNLPLTTDDLSLRTFKGCAASAHAILAAHADPYFLFAVIPRSPLIGHRLPQTRAPRPSTSAARGPTFSAPNRRSIPRWLPMALAPPQISHGTLIRTSTGLLRRLATISSVSRLVSSLPIARELTPALRVTVGEIRDSGWFQNPKEGI